MADHPQLRPGFEAAREPSSSSRPPPLPGAGPVTNGGTEPPPLPGADLTRDLQLLKLYRGREDFYAAAYVSGPNGERKVGYNPVRQALTNDDLKRHLAGLDTFGVYPIRSDSTCLFAAVDIDMEEAADLGRSEAIQIYEAAKKLGFPADAMIVPFSGGKGHHVVTFFSEPIPAGTARQFLQAILEYAGLDSDDFELFPKQDMVPADPVEVDEAGETHYRLGNLLKLPCGIHPLTGRRAEIVVAPNQVVPAPAQVVYQILSAFPAREAPRKIAEPIPDIIPEHERNNTLTSLAGSMRRRGASQSAIETALLVTNTERCRPPLSEKEIKGIAASVAGYPATTARDLHSETQGQRAKGASQATELVHQADERYEFVSDPKGRPFAIPRGGPYVARPLRGGRLSLRGELAAGYVEHHGSVPRDGALADALRVLEGKAQRTTRDLHLRVAKHGQDVILDLGRDDGQVVVIKPGGWEVTPGIPEVLFERNELTLELLIPERGGDLSALRALINVADKDWQLVVGWLVAALLPDIPHPILLFKGEHGGAKSWAARLLVRLIDPSSAELSGPPKDFEQWVTAAAGSHLVALDNLRYVDDWLSDALCRAATGEGSKRRRLYADEALTVFAFRRCVILTGIDPGGLGEDLIDRLLPVEVLVISDEQRLLEEEVEERFRVAHPRLLGALLDLFSQVLVELPRVRLEGYPRMADFARVLAALDRVASWRGFFEYKASRDDVARELLEGDSVGQAVLRLVHEQTELRDGLVADGYQLWEGTPSQLLRELISRTPNLPKSFPSEPNHLTRRLKRLAPALRSVGITVQTGREGKDSSRYVRLLKPGRQARADDTDARSQPTSASPINRQAMADATAERTFGRDVTPATPGPPPPPTDVTADEEAAQMDDEYGEWSG